MDFDVSTPSVTEALDDLQRKAQSLQEDRELYAGLDTRARAGFERHRAELTQLLQKERAIHAAAEDRLRAELQRLLAEAEALRAAIENANAERQRCARADSAHRIAHTYPSTHTSSRTDTNTNAEVAELREELSQLRADVAHAAQERAWHELQLREALTRQRGLHDALRREEEHHHHHHHHCDTESVSVWENERSGPSCRVCRVFIPAGPTDAAAPASQHIAAIVSTVERRNRLVPRLFNRRNGIPSPMERRAADSPLRRGCGRSREPPLLPRQGTMQGTMQGAMQGAMTRPAAAAEPESARHLSAVCRSLLREILQLRREYQHCTAQLASPHVDSVEVSRRMRVVMSDLDRKVHQLRSLRRQQAMVEEKLKLHDMMLEIAAENNYCESVYSDLLELIRT